MASSTMEEAKLPGGYLVTPRVPQGLAAAVEGLTREVIRHSPEDIYVFAAHHFEKLLQLRERCNSSSGKNRERGVEALVEMSRALRKREIEKENSRVRRAEQAGWSLNQTAKVLKRHRSIFGDEGRRITTDEVFRMAEGKSPEKENSSPRKRDARRREKRSDELWKASTSRAENSWSNEDERERGKTEPRIMSRMTNLSGGRVMLAKDIKTELRRNRISSKERKSVAGRSEDKSASEKSMESVAAKTGDRNNASRRSNDKQRKTDAEAEEKRARRHRESSRSSRERRSVEKTRDEDSTRKKEESYKKIRTPGMDRVKDYVVERFATARSLEELQSSNYVEKVQEIIDETGPIIKDKIEQLKSGVVGNKSETNNWLGNARKNRESQESRRRDSGGNSTSESSRNEALRARLSETQNLLENVSSGLAKRSRRSKSARSLRRFENPEAGDGASGNSSSANPELESRLTKTRDLLEEISATLSKPMRRSSSAKNLRRGLDSPEEASGRDVLRKRLDETRKLLKGISASFGKSVEKSSRKGSQVEREETSSSEERIPSKTSLPAVKSSSGKSSSTNGSRNDSENLVLPAISPEAPKSSKVKEDLILPMLSPPGTASTNEDSSKIVDTNDDVPLEDFGILETPVDDSIPEIPMENVSRDSLNVSPDFDSIPQRPDSLELGEVSEKLETKVHPEMNENLQDSASIDMKGKLQELEAAEKRIEEILSVENDGERKKEETDIESKIENTLQKIEKTNNENKSNSQRDKLNRKDDENDDSRPDKGNPEKIDRASPEPESYTYVLTEGSPYDIPDTVTTVIIPEKNFDSLESEELRIELEDGEDAKLSLISVDKEINMEIIDEEKREIVSQPNETLEKKLTDSFGEIIQPDAPSEPSLDFIQEIEESRMSHQDLGPIHEEVLEELEDLDEKIDTIEVEEIFEENIETEVKEEILEKTQNNVENEMEIESSEIKVEKEISTKADEIKESEDTKIDVEKDEIKVEEEISLTDEKIEVENNVELKSLDEISIEDRTSVTDAEIKIEEENSKDENKGETENDELEVKDKIPSMSQETTTEEDISSKDKKIEVAEETIEEEKKDQTTLEEIKTEEEISHDEQVPVEEKISLNLEELESDEMKGSKKSEREICEENIKECKSNEPEIEEIRTTDSDVSPKATRPEIDSESSNEVKESSVADEGLESTKNENSLDEEEEISVTGTAESSNEVKETTLTDGLSFSLDPTRPFVPELNLDSLQDITISSFKMTEEDYEVRERGESENTNSITETLNSDDNHRFNENLEYVEEIELFPTSSSLTGAGKEIKDSDKETVDETIVREQIEVKEEICQKTTAYVTGPSDLQESDENIEERSLQEEQMTTPTRDEEIPKKIDEDIEEEKIDSPTETTEIVPIKTEDEEIIKTENKDETEEKKMEENLEIKKEKEEDIDDVSEKEIPEDSKKEEIVEERLSHEDETENDKSEVQAVTKEDEKSEELIFHQLIFQKLKYDVLEIKQESEEKIVDFSEKDISEENKKEEIVEEQDKEESSSESYENQTEKDSEVKSEEKVDTKEEKTSTEEKSEKLKYEVLEIQQENEEIITDSSNQEISKENKKEEEQEIVEELDKSSEVKSEGRVDTNEEEKSEELKQEHHEDEEENVEKIDDRDKEEFAEVEKEAKSVKMSNELDRSQSSIEKLSEDYEQETERDLGIKPEAKETMEEKESSNTLEESFVEEETPLAVSRSASQCTTRRVSSGNLTKLREDPSLGWTIEGDDEQSDPNSTKVKFSETDDQTKDSKEFHIYVPEVDTSEQNSTTESSTFDSAVTKIQAGVRGFLTRRKLQRGQQNRSSTLNSIPSIQDSVAIEPEEIEKPALGETGVPSEGRECRARKRLRREDAVQRTTFSLEKSFAENGLQHTGEFHDCVPLPIHEIAIEKKTTGSRHFGEQNESEDSRVTSPPEATSGIVDGEESKKMLFGRSTTPLLQFVRPKVSQLVDLVVLAKEEAALQAGYLNFITSVEDAETVLPETPKNFREDDANSNESLREPLALSGPPLGIVIEEITSSDPQNFVGAEDVVQEKVEDSSIPVESTNDSEADKNVSQPPLSEENTKNSEGRETENSEIETGNSDSKEINSSRSECGETGSPKTEVGKEETRKNISASQELNFSLEKDFLGPETSVDSMECPISEAEEKSSLEASRRDGAIGPIPSPETEPQLLPETTESETRRDESIGSNVDDASSKFSLSTKVEDILGQGSEDSVELPDRKPIIEVTLKPGNILTSLSQESQLERIESPITMMQIAPGLSDSLRRESSEINDDDDESENKSKEKTSSKAEERNA